MWQKLLHHAQSAIITTLFRLDSGFAGFDGFDDFDVYVEMHDPGVEGGGIRSLIWMIWTIFKAAHIQ